MSKSTVKESNTIKLSNSSSSIPMLEDWDLSASMQSNNKVHDILESSKSKYN